VGEQTLDQWSSGRKIDRLMGRKGVYECMERRRKQLWRDGRGKIEIEGKEKEMEMDNEEGEGGKRKCNITV
jgi:hypothetical protein